MFSLYAQFILYDCAVNICRPQRRQAVENNVVDANQRHFSMQYHE